MKTIYYLEGKERKLFGFVPDRWVWRGEMLQRPGDTQAFHIPQEVPSRPYDVNAEPVLDVHTFRLRLEEDRDGDDRFRRIPIFFLIDGAKALIDHPNVATFPEARKYYV